MVRGSFSYLHFILGSSCTLGRFSSSFFVTLVVVVDVVVVSTRLKVLSLKRFQMVDASVNWKRTDSNREISREIGRT